MCFLAGLGESLLSSECSDPGLTPRRYYFSVPALGPKSCQHIFYPFPPHTHTRAQYIPPPPPPSRLMVSSLALYIAAAMLDDAALRGFSGRVSSCFEEELLPPDMTHMDRFPDVSDIFHISTWERAQMWTI